MKSLTSSMDQLGEDSQRMYTIYTTFVTAMPLLAVMLLSVKLPSPMALGTSLNGPLQTQIIQAAIDISFQEPSDHGVQFKHASPPVLAFA